MSNSGINLIVWRGLLDPRDGLQLLRVRGGLQPFLRILAMGLNRLHATKFQRFLSGKSISELKISNPRIFSCTLNGVLNIFAWSGLQPFLHILGTGLNLLQATHILACVLNHKLESDVSPS